ncbi:hypothetical protein PDESU_01693 [Pontiella desulfatans]|uniref:PEP-CTERM protein-sorting domain-containing protein n=1 Tax=Pontiella desulfatans TaxID=2750659 RepID=A0A6C2TZZ5_PONDE|nr:PEP-CTERM sorting domain-containing protein [Pontiella desulfatans]VGO13139.1 hypothetical protein PDESU_01693 [Pontiella desulfatans]
MKKTISLGLLGLFLVGIVQADTVLFSNFNNVSNVDGVSTNTAGAIGGTINSITRTVVGDNYNFAISYTDTEGEALTFDLIVEGYTGGVITSSLTGNGTGTSGSATIGTTSAAVGEVTGGTIVGAAFGVGNSMEGTGSLKFSVANLAYKGGSATFDGFSAAFSQEYNQNNHIAVVGSGTGLFEHRWGQSSEQQLTTGDVSNLYISGATGGNDRWGVSSLDFGITTIIPEPATMGMIMASGFGIIFIRRRFMM